MSNEKWTLKEIQNHPKNKEKIYIYENGKMGFSFYMHPTKAWNFCLFSFTGISQNKAWVLIDKWLENAIGPSEQFNERIKFFEA